ncbi:hypothetical protein KAX75_09990 [candidate division WOR-3 bacterium]|nr:hypothetical protein [candidate division WOR-3 bacterium]
MFNRKDRLILKSVFFILIWCCSFLLLPSCYRQGSAKENHTIEHSEGFTDEDFKKHLEEIKELIPDEGFTIIIQKPFVVIGNESPERVKYRSEKTVKWTVNMIKNDYFSKDPEDIIDIWLFKNKESYMKYSKEIFGDEPTTPFGYYSDYDKALVMNISTGGGTLVHEIVHPFMHSNFPECPSWFDEGLASLYEQCGEKDGHIYGYTNWRLEGLQDAIKNGVVPSFKKLTSMSSYAFYTKDKGTNYGQSRYLCYYLQEKGLLVKFYHEFYKARKEDPTGYNTLKKILDVEDMDDFKKKWEVFVLVLTFP